MNKDNLKSGRYDRLRYEPDHEWNKELDTLDGERFVEAFMVIEDRSLLKLFVSDLFTEKEIGQFIKRFEGVYWLSLGMPYARIQETTGLSPKIIARLNKSLTNKAGGFWQVMQGVYPNEAAHFDHTETVTR